MHKVEFSDEVIARIRARRSEPHMYEAGLEPAHTALLVVDMQAAFVAEGASAEIPIAREIVPNINRLAATVRQTGGLIVWIVSTYGPNQADRWPTFYDHVMDPEPGKRFRDALTTGAAGHEIYSGLAYEPGEPIVEKNRFGAFIGSQGRLERLLRERDIDTILITGTVTNVCCETTAREAAAYAFKTIMVTDGNAARCDEEHNATLSTFWQAMGDVLPTDRLIAALEAGARAAPGATRQRSA